MKIDFLYHYSVEKYPQILSKVGQGVSPVLPDPFAYGNSISFFDKPIPRDIAARYHNEHNFWVAGKKLHEYIIPVRTLPEQLNYRVVESPEKTKLLYVTQKWFEGMGDALVAANKRQIAQMEDKLGYKGTTKTGLLKALDRIPNKDYIKMAYDLAVANPDDKILDKYAACVPHVILYVGSMPVNYISSERITLR